MLHTVILAGGSGTRFWPLSRRDRPKQFLDLLGDGSLIRATWERVVELTGPERVYVVTSDLLAAGVREHLPGLPTENLLVEPAPRNTAAAIGLAAAVIGARDPEAILAVLPADHVIRPAERFRATLTEAAALADADDVIVTIGIPPRSPHTGYGYIRRGAAVEGAAGELPVHTVEAFEEKPDAGRAATFVASGQHSWNAGIFVWRAATILSALAQHLPATRDALGRIASAWGSETRAQVLREEYEALERISIDYAVLEKADRVLTIEAPFSWSDVGGWAALHELLSAEADPNGNVSRDGTLTALDARDNLVVGDGRLVALLGVEGLVVVQTRDATLVCPRDRAEEVKEIVSILTGDLEAYS